MGKKFVMVEVHDYNSLETYIDTFRKIAAHLKKQEERLVLLDTPDFNLNTNREMAEFFLTLQKNVHGKESHHLHDGLSPR